MSGYRWSSEGSASRRVNDGAESRDTLTSLIGVDGHVYIDNVASGEFQGHFRGMSFLLCA